MALRTALVPMTVASQCALLTTWGAHRIRFLSGALGGQSVTVRSAQIWLVAFSLFTLLIICTTFITGSLWGFPLDYANGEDAPLVQLSVPPFFGILGSAANFLRSPGKVELEEDHQTLLRLMVLGPSCLFLILFTILSTTFYFANMAGSQAIFTLESYRLWVTILLAMITSSVPILLSFIFKRTS